MITPYPVTVTDTYRQEDRREDRLPSPEEMSLQPARRPLVGLLTKIVAACMTAGVVGVIAAARTELAAPVTEPPQRLLPGSPMVPEAVCDASRDGEYRCFVRHGDQVIWLAYDGAAQAITSTAFSVREETVGELLIAWGTPTGVAEQGGWITVYWGTRSAHLPECRVQPGSPVGYLAYGPMPKLGKLSAWRGFTTYCQKDH